MTTLQDSQGFVWLGTEDGLVRFDGHELYPLRATRAPRRGSLPGNFIWQVVEDAAPRPVDRDQGRGRRALEPRHRHVHRLSPRPERIRHRSRATACAPCSSMRAAASGSAPAMRASTFSIPSRDASSICGTMPTTPASLSSDRIFTLALDRAGDVWIGTDGGLDRWQRRAARSCTFGPPRARRIRCATSRSRACSRIRAARSGSARSTPASRGSDRDGRVLETFRHDARDAGLAQQRRRARDCSKTGRAPVGRHRGRARSARSLHRRVQSLPPRRERRASRCAIRSSCRCIRIRPASCGSARAPAA